MRTLLSVALPLALVTTLTSVAAADVPGPSPGGKCKCSLIGGAPAEGAAPAAVVGLGAVLLFAARGRKRR